MAAEMNIDEIILKLLGVREVNCAPGQFRIGRNVFLTEDEVNFLCYKAETVFMHQPMLLDLQAPIKICGDIHGQYYDLLRLFECGNVGFVLCAHFLTKHVQARWISVGRIEVFVPWRLCRPRQALLGDNLFATGLQDQASSQLFPPSREPRRQRDQPQILVRGRMQTAVTALTHNNTTAFELIH
jgi:hypothetical protein